MRRRRCLRSGHLRRFQHQRRRLASADPIRQRDERGRRRSEQRIPGGDDQSLGSRAGRAVHDRDRSHPQIFQRRRAQDAGGAGAGVLLDAAARAVASLARSHLEGISDGKVPSATKFSGASRTASWDPRRRVPVGIVQVPTANPARRPRSRRRGTCASWSSSLPPLDELRPARHAGHPVEHSFPDELAGQPTLLEEHVGDPMHGTLEHGRLRHVR
jgi:hypothetical protein